MKEKTRITTSQVYNAVEAKLTKRSIEKEVLTYAYDEDGNETLVKRQVTREEREPDSNLLAKMYDKVVDTERAELEKKLIQSKITDLEGDHDLKSFLEEQLNELRNPE